MMGNTLYLQIFINENIMDTLMILKQQVFLLVQGEGLQDIAELI